MKKQTLVRTAASLLAAIALVGCGDELGDRESEGGQNADAIEDTYNVTVYRNINRYPNVAVFCAEGLGFAASSSGTDGSKNPDLIRVPEIDGRCAR